MSSMLAALRKRPEEDQAPRRWVTILDEEASIKAPKFELWLEFGHPEWTELILKPFRKQVGQFDLMSLDWPYTALRQEDRHKYLTTFFQKAKGWRGFGRLNAGRLFPGAVENLEALQALPEEIPFDDEVRDEFAIMLDRSHFPLIYRAVTDTAEWGVELQARKKPDLDGRD